MATTGNPYPNWLGTATTTANAATTSVAVNGLDGQGKTVNTTIATIPTFVFNSVATPITFTSLTAGTVSTFSTCMLSTGTYWVYADVDAKSNATGWASTDSINFWISDSQTLTATNASAWPELAGRPYYQAFANGSAPLGQGLMAMTYSGWLTLPQNSVVYNNVRMNSGTSAQNNTFSLYSWSFQKMR
jgi:hypothetical protein